MVDTDDTRQTPDDGQHLGYGISSPKVSYKDTERVIELTVYVEYVNTVNTTLVTLFYCVDDKTICLTLHSNLHSKIHLEM